MAKDVSDVVRDALGPVVKEATKSLAGNGRKKSSGGALSGGRGLAAGAGLAALIPLASKGAGKLLGGRLQGGNGPGGLVDKAQDKLKDNAKEIVDDKVGEAGGVGGIAKEGLKSMVPGMGGDSSGGGGEAKGTGKGRRMPVQQSVDVAVPLETAYNQWTQFEDWTTFMHRLQSVSQEDECTVAFKAKIWGISKEFKAEIETQRPDERIKWKVTQGLSHTGVVTFHELAPKLTRIELSFDVDPGSLIEKAARGMRHVKRAARADLHRFKAFIEMQEVETGAWRGVIEEGELVEEHPEDYDEEREYSDPEDALEDTGDEDDDSEDEDEDSEERPRRSRQRGGDRSGGSSGQRRRGSSNGGDRSRSRSSASSNRKSSASRSSGNRSSNSGNSSSNKKSSGRKSSGQKSSGPRSSGQRKSRSRS
jgi:uncharacterized membrane protein